MQLRPAAAGSSPAQASAGQLAYLLASPWQQGLSSDPVVAYLDALDMTRLLDEISDAVACGYAPKLEARVGASPRLAAALRAAQLAQVERATPSHPALQRTGAALDQVPDDQQLQILAWMLHRRGVSTEATALVEGVLAMREQGAAQPEPTPPGAGSGSRAPAAAGAGPIAGATMPGAPPPVEPGPWAPPGDQPIPLYIGNSVHREVALHYQAAHGGEHVLSNFYSLSSVLRELEHTPTPGSVIENELATKPDIVNLTRLHLYEIKPVAAQAVGAAKAALAVGVSAAPASPCSLGR